MLEFSELETLFGEPGSSAECFRDSVVRVFPEGVVCFRVVAVSCVVTAGGEDGKKEKVEKWKQIVCGGKKREGADGV